MAVNECLDSKDNHRTRLPVPAFSTNDNSVWNILKQCIGKDLSKVTMPVVFNEPLSFLQRLSEYMEYAHLLTDGTKSEDPVERMKFVVAFAVSALASNWKRMGKPFNPVLGETYELEMDDFRIVSEQVCHHPPVSAFHADDGHRNAGSHSWVFHGSIQPKIKFWGKSMEIQPKGHLNVTFPRHNETYTWSNVNCTVHNLISGRMWMEQTGTMEITNHRTGHKCMLNFKPVGWFNKNVHHVEGHIADASKKKLCFLYGKWTEVFKSTDMTSYEEYKKVHSDKFQHQDSLAPGQGNTPRNTPTVSPSHMPKKVAAKLNSLGSMLSASFSTSISQEFPSKSANGAEEVSGSHEQDDGCPEEECHETQQPYSIDIPNSTILWHCHPRPEYSSEYFNFTYMAMRLNEAVDRSTIPPTDSRLREDIRKLEEGEIDVAGDEKTKLEEKHRDMKKARKKASNKDRDPWTPRWFHHTKNQYTKEDDWLYNGDYWKKDFSSCSEIF